MPALASDRRRRRHQSSPPAPCGAIARRTSVAAAALGAVLALGSAAGCDPTCTPPEINCRGACVDTSSDPSNCGLCGGVCAQGDSCSGGQCVVPLCSAGLTPCSDAGACANLAADNANCGACGTTCNGDAGLSCQSGVCAIPCPTGYSACGNACKALASDPQNCGACGVACAANVQCISGQCAACTGGYTLCNSGCADTSNDPRNCGTCGTTCIGGYCVQGVCF